MYIARAKVHDRKKEMQKLKPNCKKNQTSLKLQCKFDNSRHCDTYSFMVVPKPHTLNAG